jgi:TPR repeat protein
MGVTEDPVEAAKWFRKAAEQGIAGSQQSLGAIYHLGRGVPQNHKEALKWYRKAARQGNPGAQFNLGMLYFAGKGIPRDFIKAHMWSNLSSTGLRGPNQEQAATLRNAIAREMTSRQIAEAQQMACEWAPAPSE